MRSTERLCSVGLAPVAVALVALVISPSGAASITAATEWQSPTLAVDARGNALVSWTQGAARRTLWSHRRAATCPAGGSPARM